MSDNLMSRDEVAELLGIKPNSVRDTLRRYGITEQRGYPRAEVEALRRPGQGFRTDLADSARSTGRLMGEALVDLHRAAGTTGRLMGETLAALHKKAEQSRKRGGEEE